MVTEGRGTLEMDLDLSWQAAAWDTTRNILTHW